MDRRGTSRSRCASGWRHRRASTAICAYNDVIAYAVLAGIRDSGLVVPGDIAVIGVDNDPIGSLVEPSLTTIDTRHLEVADELARLVIAARRGRASEMRPISHEYGVIVRASTP